MRFEGDDFKTSSDVSIDKSAIFLFVIIFFSKRSKNEIRF